MTTQECIEVLDNATILARQLKRGEIGLLDFEAKMSQLVWERRTPSFLTFAE